MRSNPDWAYNSTIKLKTLKKNQRKMTWVPCLPRLGLNSAVKPNDAEFCMSHDVQCRNYPGRVDAQVL